MEFGLSDDQRMLQDSLNKFLEDASPLEKVREVIGGDTKAADEIWAGLTELGAHSAFVPEEFGGLGMTLLDAALIQEALGRVVAPLSFTTNAMATVALLAAGSEAQKLELLPKIADGSARFAIATSERTGAREGAGLDASDGKISGKAMFVLGDEAATDFIVVDQTGGLHHIAASEGGLTQNDLPTIEKTRKTSEVIFDSVAASPLSAENEVGAAADKMIAAGRVLLAADSLGAGQRMIEKSVEYSLERKQFNRIIGSFQAVKHLCAEMASELEPCRSLVWYAAHTYDAVPEEFLLTAAHAKSHLAEVGQFVARTSTEVHGGIGFTDLMGLHFWFKRIGFNRQLLGGPERVRQEIAKMQGWGL